MDSNIVTCPLCKDSQGVSVKVAFSTDVRTYSCARCGRFDVTEEGLDYLAEPEFRASAHLLSGLTRAASDRGVPLTIMQKNLDQLLQAANRPRDIADGSNRLLQWIGARSGTFGEAIEVQPFRDYPILFARNGEEFEFFLDHLVDRGLLRARGSMGAGFELTPAGWDQLAALHVPSTIGNRVFVAMSFASDLRSAYTDGIRPALEASGYLPVRVDDLDYNERIDDRIVVEIRQSRFIVADCTQHRGGVYFEAGYALGMGLQVVWTCRNDDVANLHFDTRQYNHIVWTDPAQLKERLLARILATIGPGKPAPGAA